MCVCYLDRGGPCVFVCVDLTNVRHRNRLVFDAVFSCCRRRTAQHYRHRASPDCNTVASFDSSSSESRNGLNR